MRYFKEFYNGTKFLGMIVCEKDREVMGYIGQKKEVLKQSITLSNKKIIKENTEVTTMLFPLVGKMN